jgi:hypothetical protein
VNIPPTLVPGLRHAIGIVQRLAQRTDGNSSQYADGWRMALEEILFHIGQDIERIGKDA